MYIVYYHFFIFFFFSFHGLIFIVLLQIVSLWTVYIVWKYSIVRLFHSNLQGYYYKFHSKWNRIIRVLCFYSAYTSSAIYTPICCKIVIKWRKSKGKAHFVLRIFAVYTLLAPLMFIAWNMYSIICYFSEQWIIQ